MAQFAKIFELPDDHQLLVTKEYDDNLEEHKLRRRIFYSDLNIEMDLSFENEQDLNNAFEEFDNKNAEKVFKGVKSIIPENK